MIRGPQDLPEVRRLIALADLALAAGTLSGGERKALERDRARVAELLERAEIEERLSEAVARGQKPREREEWAPQWPPETCLAHLQPEPCRQCAAYVAAGL